MSVRTTGRSIFREYTFRNLQPHRKLIALYLWSGGEVRKNVFAIDPVTACNDLGVDAEFIVSEIAAVANAMGWKIVDPPVDTDKIPTPEGLVMADRHWQMLEKFGSSITNAEHKSEWVKRNALGWDRALRSGLKQGDFDLFIKYVESDKGAFWRDKVLSAVQLWTMKEGKRKIQAILDQARNKGSVRRSFRDRGAIHGGEIDEKDLPW